LVIFKVQYNIGRIQ